MQLNTASEILRRLSTNCIKCNAKDRSDLFNIPLAIRKRTLSCALFQLIEN